MTASDLRVAQGQVRCGRCLAIFNALVTLYDDVPGKKSSDHAQNAAPAPATEPKPPAAPTPPKPVAPSAPTAKQPAIKEETHEHLMKTAVMTVESFADTGTPDDFNAQVFEGAAVAPPPAAPPPTAPPPVAPATPEESAQKTEAALDQATTVIRPAASADPLEIPGAAANDASVGEPDAANEPFIADPVPANEEPVTVPGLPALAEPDADEIAAPIAAPLAVAAVAVAATSAIAVPPLGNAIEVAPPTDAADSELTELGDGEVQRDSPHSGIASMRRYSAHVRAQEEAAIEPVTWQQRRHRYGAAALVLAAVLALQLIHFNRSSLATWRYIGPGIQGFYSAVGAPIAPRWDAASYDVKQQGAVAGTDAASPLTVRASILNHGSQPQPLPLLRVTLQDRYGNKIALRDLEPREYLPIAGPESVLTPGQRVDAEVALADPGGKAVGFEIDACLRVAPGRFSCANDQNVAKK